MKIAQKFISGCKIKIPIRVPSGTNENDAVKEHRYITLIFFHPSLWGLMGG
jgi:hypothetical protein